MPLGVKSGLWTENPTIEQGKQYTELFMMRKIITQRYLLGSVYNAVKVNCNYVK